MGKTNIHFAFKQFLSLLNSLSLVAFTPRYRIHVAMVQCNEDLIQKIHYRKI